MKTETYNVICTQTNHDVAFALNGITDMHISTIVSKQKSADKVSSFGEMPLAALFTAIL